MQTEVIQAHFIQVMPLLVEMLFTSGRMLQQAVRVVQKECTLTSRTNQLDLRLVAVVVEQEDITLGP